MLLVTTCVVVWIEIGYYIEYKGVPCVTTCVVVWIEIIFRPYFRRWG